MSKAQKNNRENKKPKADKNREKSVSAYKAVPELQYGGPRFFMALIMRPFCT